MNRPEETGARIRVALVAEKNRARPAFSAYVSMGDWCEAMIVWEARRELAAELLATLDSNDVSGAGVECKPDERGMAGDRCTAGNECGRIGCPECQP